MTQDDPNTKAGRAAMLARANAEKAEAEHAVDVWTGCVAEIQDLQRKSGD